MKNTYEMVNGLLSREEAIKIVGEEAVNEVEYENCEPTSRCREDWFDTEEWEAHITCEDASGNDVILYAYYYPSKEEVFANAETPDMIDWVIAGYLVELLYCYLPNS
jgi:hypothetical protein